MIIMKVVTIIRLKYLKNLLSFFVFNFINLFLKRNSSSQKSIMFMNSGALGDTIISSIILDYDFIFPGYDEVVFLYPQEYSTLFINYDGNIKLIPYNKKKYKWSIIYRIKLLKTLRKLKLKKTFNLTSSRGISSDEIALLSGATEIYCFENSWKKIFKAFSNTMDKKYTEVLYKEESNEYVRHLKIINLFDSGINHIDIQSSCYLIKPENTKITDLVNSLDNYVVLAPLAGDRERTWGLNNYLKLCEHLTNSVNVVIIGSKKEKRILNAFGNLNKKVMVLSGELSLIDLFFLINNSLLYIGNDSGLTHLALRTKIPIMAIIGGGTFNKYFPYTDRKNTYYFYKNMDCFRCDWNCIHPERFCLTDVLYSEVLNSANQQINVLKSED